MDSLNLNPALKNFFNFNQNGQQQQARDAEQGGLHSPLLGNNSAGAGQAPVLTTRADETVAPAPRNSCMSRAKTALWIFVFYAVIGCILAIFIQSALVILVVTVVVLFILIQVLTQSGMVAINWGNVGNSMIRSVDRDGDGRFGWADAKAWLSDFVTFVTAKGIPAVSGFALGLFIGWKLF